MLELKYIIKDHLSLETKLVIYSPIAIRKGEVFNTLGNSYKVTEVIYSVDDKRATVSYAELYVEDN